MSDLNRSTSPPNSASLRPPKKEQILSEQVLEEEHGAKVPSVGSPEPSPTPVCEPQEAVDAVPSVSQQTNNWNPSDPRRPARKEPFFGIPQSSAVPLNVNPNYDDDYEKRFPPDPIYEEVSSPNARVYRVYMEESAKYDAYMTDEAREGLDVLLVFAGLFSAVLTTFVAQTSQSLQPDRATESTLLLREIAALQRAQMNGTSVDSIPSTPADFVPSSIDVWVNGLWFTSLTLSLASALFAVLIKQWIRHYTSFVSGTAKERSLIRQYRFMGLQKWHVPTLIGILPVLMHLSLAIFFVGLTLFLAPLRPSIAGIVGSLSTLIFVAYVATAVWPLFRIECPYRTPLSTIIYDITFPLYRYMFRMLYKYMFCMRKYMLRKQSWRYVSLKEQEHGAAQSGEALVAHAFEWLLRMSSNPSVHRVVVQAVGGFYKSSSILEKLVDNESLRSTWSGMFYVAIGRSTNRTCILPEKVDLLERLFRSALHIRQFESFWVLSDSNVRTAIQSFPAPTLQWESAVTALLWRYGICTKGGDFKDTALAQKACTVVDCFMSDSREKGTLLPVIVWDDLLAAASSCPSIVPRPDLSDPVYDLNKRIIHELTRHVCLGPSLPGRVYCAGEPTSFGHALEADVNFVWSLLPPFDKHEGNVLDSKKVQHLLTLVNAIVSHELYEVSSNIFFGTCKALILELQVGSVTLKDQKAICVATDALVQEGIVLRDTLGPITVLLPSLIFLRCWKPNIMSRTAILHALIEIDMFKVLNRLGDKGLTWLWSANKNGFHSGNNTAPVASLITFVIRGSFESRTGPESQPEDFRWLEYLFLSENSAPIVAMFTFQGTRDAPASVEQVRDDLLLFFSSQSLDCDTLQKCGASLESHLKDFVHPKYWDTYGANMKEARKVIDEHISKQSPKLPAGTFSRLVRRSKKSVADPEARD